MTSLTFPSTELRLTNCFFLARSTTYGTICSVNFDRIALTITSVVSNWNVLTGDANTPRNVYSGESPVQHCRSSHSRTPRRINPRNNWRRRRRTISTLDYSRRLSAGDDSLQGKTLSLSLFTFSFTNQNWSSMWPTVCSLCWSVWSTESNQPMEPDAWISIG